MSNRDSRRRFLADLRSGAIGLIASRIAAPALTIWSAGSRSLASVFNNNANVKKGPRLQPTEMWGWGSIGNGGLGTGDGNGRSSPHQVGGRQQWVQMSSGPNHSVGLKADGSIWAVGYNGSGELGQGFASFPGLSSPVQVGSATDWVQVSCNNYGSHALKADGTVWFWGGSGNGSSGIIDNLPKSLPTQVTGLSGVVALESHFISTTARTASGSAYFWGGHNDVYRNSGIPAVTTEISSPMLISAVSDWVQLSSCSHTAGIRANGTLWTCGRNNAGQLGLGTVTTVSSLTQVGLLSNWARVSTGGTFTVALKSDGTLWSWGSNTAGELGQNMTSTGLSSPTQIGADTDWVDVQCGFTFTVAQKANGTLWSWGTGGAQLGVGDSLPRSSPTQIGTSAWTQVFVGQSGAHALKARP